MNRASQIDGDIRKAIEAYGKSTAPEAKIDSKKQEALTLLEKIEQQLSQVRKGALNVLAVFLDEIEDDEVEFWELENVVAKLSKVDAHLYLIGVSPKVRALKGLDQVLNKIKFVEAQASAARTVQQVLSYVQQSLI